MVVCVYFDLKSVQTKILSNFSKVWFDRLLVQVNFLPDKSISLRFKVSITALNIKRPSIAVVIIVFLIWCANNVKTFVGLIQFLRQTGDKFFFLMCFVCRPNSIWSKVNCFLYVSYVLI
jgi:uncharacterized membrane protein YoaT (DUF817 family)